MANIKTRKNIHENDDINKSDGYRLQYLPLPVPTQISKKNPAKLVISVTVLEHNICIFLFFFTFFSIFFSLLIGGM